MYKTGIDKNQQTFLPMCLDDFVSENHICRVISAFTKQLDLVALGYKYAQRENYGRPSYDPRMMLDLYIYGYLHRVRSSRRLQAEAQRNVEVMWLMDGLVPDDKTICNFRKDNAEALRKTFRAFTLLCNEFGLYGGTTVAIDGTKIRADNSRKHNHNSVTVERELQRIDKQIEEHIAALDKYDAREDNDDRFASEDIKRALEKLGERKEKYEILLVQVSEEKEVSTIDPDSRLMRQGGDGRALNVGYNVQTAVDDKYNLVVDFKITDRSDDKGNLCEMSALVKEVLQSDELKLLADKGYYDGEDIARSEENGVICYVAKPSEGGPHHAEGYNRENFTFDKEKCVYICPCGYHLKFMRRQIHNNAKEYEVYANYSACSKCLSQKKCSKAKYRQILRLPYQNILDEVNERTHRNKALYRKRQAIVEHQFGTIKHIWGFRQFLCRTKPKVTAEMSLAYLAYNLRRLINIFEANGNNPRTLIESLG